MNRKLASALVACILTISANSPSSAFDSTLPILVSASTNTNSVPETGGTVVLTVVVKTSSYDFDQNPLPVVNVNTRPFSCTGKDGLRMSLLSGDAKNGTYKCDMIFTSPLKPGVYPMTIFPLTDKGGNTTGFLDPKINITIGNPQVTPVPTPSPTPTPTPTPTKNVTLDQSAVIADLSSQLALLKSQITNLEAQLKKSTGATNSAMAKLKKICLAKPKPKGC